MPRPRVSIVTFGCRANQYESDLMRGLLSKGYEIVSSNAEVWILNACTVTALAERKARQAARRVHREQPAALVVVVGCLADAVDAGLSEFPGADLLAGNSWKGHIDRVVEEALAGTRGLLPPTEPLAAADERSNGPEGRVRAFLRIQDGCSRACTYCRATQVRGEPRSKPVPDVLEEARGLIQAGFPEIVLTGIDLAQYAPPQGTLADAVRAVLSIDKLARLRIASINSSGISTELIEVFASDDRACPHFHVPLQSGDDGALELMARGYTAAEYVEAIERVRRTLPAATFGTDVIVGFPGETAAAFENTCHVIEAVGFVNLHAFRYSARPGTAAATFKDAVPEPTKRARADELVERWHRASQPILDKRIGSTQDVLVEERREGVWRGYTRDYIRVRFTSTEEIPIGSIRAVRVTGAATEHLEGNHEQRANAH